MAYMIATFCHFCIHFERLCAARIGCAIIGQPFSVEVNVNPRTILPLGLLVLSTVSAFGQESRATLLGTVTDPSGAVIPGVDIIVQNTRTNSKTAVVSNESGYFEAPFLLPGSYRLEAQLTGFKRYLREGIALQTGERVTLNFSLELGQTTEQVTVVATAQLLETNSASSGQVIDNRRINELPVTDMNPFALAHLASGVARNAEPMFNRAFDNGRTSNISIAGAGNRGNEWTLDGMPNSTAGNQVSYVPPTEAVQEFKVEISSFDAASGHVMGGSINVSIKSGTNDFHGSIYDQHRQQRWNATDWFVNRAFWSDVKSGRLDPSSERQRSGRYNQFGATLGGPVRLPWVYNGRDRTFFFFSYNGIYDANQEPTFYRMPTALERTGNFSELLARGGSEFQIYNPTTARLSGTRVVRDPFPGNIIPASMISPIARKYMEFFPLPNNTEAAGRDLSNNYLAAQQPRNENFFSLLNRLDHQLTGRHKLFGRWHYNNRLQDRNDWTGRGLQTNGLRRINAGAGIDEVFTINGRTVLNLNFGWNMFRDGNEQRTDGFDLGELGFPGYLRQQAGDLQHMPRVSISTLPVLGNPRSGSETRHVFSLKGGVAHSMGSHTLRWGAEARSYQRNNRAPGFVGGSFTFTNSYTRQDSVTTAQQSGLALASFLLGYPSAGLVDVNDSYAQQNYWWGAYVQDDWRITSRLTLNLGLRYEYEAPTSERFNRFTVGYDFATPSPIASSAEAAYARSPLAELPASQFKVTGGPMFAGVKGAPDRMWNGDTKDFMPRLGAAYKVTDKMVLRGGYGLFFNTSTGVQDTPGFQYGYSQSTTLIPTLDNGLTFTATMADPFPAIQEGNVRFLRPVGSSRGLSQQLGLAYSFLNVDRRNPYQHRWRLGLQYQFSSTVVAEMSYTGSTTRRIHVDRRINALPERYWASGYTRNTAIETDLATLVANPFRDLIAGTGFNGATIAKQTLLRPYPQFSNLTIEDEPIGASFFHSMEMTVEKRFSRGWTLLAAFTKLKQIDQTTRLNEFDTQLDRILGDFDREHRIVVSGIYELPFGRRRAFGASVPAWLDHIAGGWQFGAIYQAQTGRPIRFPNAFYTGNTADIVLPDSEQTPDRWFNTAGFVTASATQPGTFHRRVFPVLPDGRLRQDPLNLWDMNLLKRFEVRESVGLQVRVDLLNALNHAHFDIPNAAPTNGNFAKSTALWGLPRLIQFSLRLLF
jgi:hypothetical protein